MVRSLFEAAAWVQINRIILVSEMLQDIEFGDESVDGRNVLVHLKEAANRVTTAAIATLAAANASKPEEQRVTLQGILDTAL